MACAGNPHADGDAVVVADPAGGTWQRVVTDADGQVLGAVLVGDTRPYAMLVQAVRGMVAAPDVLGLLRPAGAAVGAGPADLPDEAGVCSCHNVACGAIRAAVDEGFEDVAGVKRCTKAGTGCGSCVPVISELIDARLAAAGKVVVKRLCAHFAMTRPELFEVVRRHGHPHVHRARRPSRHRSWL